MGAGKIESVFGKIISAVTAATVFGMLIISALIIEPRSKMLHSNRIVTACLVLIVASIIIALCVGGSRLIDRLSTVNLWRAAAVLFFLICVAEIAANVLFPTVPRTDEYRIKEEAIRFVESGDSVFDSSVRYFAIYENQYFVTIFLVWIYRFSKLTAISFDFLCNVVMFIATTASVVIVFFTAKKMFSLKNAVKVLGFILINPTSFILQSWFYTVGMSMPFFCAVIYLSVSIWKNKRTKQRAVNSVLMAICLVVGFNFRPTVAIAFMAAALVFALAMISSHKVIFNKKNLKSVLLCFLCFIITASSVQFCAKTTIKKYQAEDVNFLPLMHWVMMGLGNDGRYAQVDVNYSLEFDKMDRAKADSERVEERLKDFTPLAFVKHLAVKLKNTWCYGTAGYIATLRQEKTYNKVFTYIVEGKNDIAVLYCQAFRVAMFVFMFVFIIGVIRKYSRRDFLLVLILFGGIVFYEIWESKSVYSQPFLPVFMLMMCSSVSSVSKFFFKHADKKSGRIGLAVISLVGVGVILVSSFVLNGKLTKDKYVYADNVFLISANYGNFNHPISNDETVITQEFSSSKKFNYIEFQLPQKNAKQKAGSVTKLHVSLINSKNEVLFSDTVKATNHKSAKNIKLKVDEVVPSGNETYKLTIENINGKKIYLAAITNGYINPYEGSCYVNNKKADFKLLLSVSNRITGPYTSTFTYCLVTAIFVLLVILSWLILRKKDVKNLSQNCC